MPEENDAVARLAPLIDEKALRYGLDTPLPGVMISRVTHPSQPLATVQHPVFSLVAQGVKEAMIGKDIIRYFPGQTLVAGVDLPVSSRIIEATPDTPYLSVSIALDPSIIVDLLGEQPVQSNADERLRPFSVKPFDPRIADPLIRLLDLLDHPEDIAALARPITREIIWRLLQGPFGPLLRELACPEGQIARIGRAARWMRENYAENLRIADLADRVNMSVPSFNRHFRAVTTVSPLQFQKQIRLHTARRRLLASEPVAAVAYDVGYESLSQFNRDYRNLYGLAPSQDVVALRRGLQTVARPEGRHRGDDGAAAMICGQAQASNPASTVTAAPVRN